MNESGNVIDANLNVPQTVFYLLLYACKSEVTALCLRTLISGLYSRLLSVREVVLGRTTHDPHD